MRVDELSPAPGSAKAKKRVGRGIGGKGGKTAGAGTKGQHSRGRGKVARGFEGGQMPLKQRVPKLKGFNNPFRVEYSPVNLDQLAGTGESTVDPDVLVAKGRCSQEEVSPGKDRLGNLVSMLVGWSKSNSDYRLHEGRSE